MEPRIATTGRDSAHIVRLRLIQGLAKPFFVPPGQLFN